MNQNKFFLFTFTLVFVNFELFSKNLDHLELASGFKISIFAEGLDSPRQMAEGENGTIFVAERGGQILALIDSDKNGQIDSKIVVAKDLTLSTGLSLFDGDLYFSEISKIWKINSIEEWLKNQTDINELPDKNLVIDGLPDDTWHGWKWLQHDQQGRLHFNVGAPCNICLSENKQFASILRIENGQLEPVARGVRNSVGFDFHPQTKKLFFTDNGRDWLGDDSPSCELNRVDIDGQFYGYPYKHASNTYDPEFGSINPGYNFIDPILELGAHVAPTGVSFQKGDMFPDQMRDNLFVALHGSWNRAEKVGYKLLRVTMDKKGDVVSSKDFITGWLKNGKVTGRPSAPLFRNDGSLLLSDDKANVIYLVTYKG
jgi:glucose/arabinose dehydrogenase